MRHAIDLILATLALVLTGIAIVPFIFSVMVLVAVSWLLQWVESD